MSRAARAPFFRRDRAVVLLLVAVQTATALATELWGAPSGGEGPRGFPLDDTWIHLVYARSLAAFEGFAYNAGTPAAGFTSPLWVLVLTPAFWIAGGKTAALVVAVKALSVACAGLAAVLAWAVTRAATGRRAAALLAGLLVALDPGLTFASLSGMEVMLAASAALGLLLALERGGPWTIGAAAALAPLARPELALLSAAALGVALADGPRRGAARRAVALGLPPLAAAAAWVGWCLHATGHPLPTTFYAKHGEAGLEAITANAAALGQMLHATPWFWLGCGLPLYAVGAVVVLRAGRDRGRTATAALLVGAPWLFAAGLAVSHRLQQPEPFYWSRYLLPVLPLLLIPLAVGLHAAAARARSAWAAGTPRGRALAAALAALCVLPFVRLPAKSIDAAERLRENCRDIDEAQVVLGRWLAERAKPDAVIAVNDAGAIRFFSGRRVIDLAGLNDHRVLERGALAEIEEERPDYVVIFPSWARWFASRRDYRVIRRLRDDHYTICRCAQSAIYVYERVDPAS